MNGLENALWGFRRRINTAKGCHCITYSKTVREHGRAHRAQHEHQEFPLFDTLKIKWRKNVRQLAGGCDAFSIEGYLLYDLCH
jgi:hypothetical protein